MTLSSSSWSTTIDRPANHGTSSRGSLRFGANRRKPSERFLRVMAHLPGLLLPHIKVSTKPEEDHEADVRYSLESINEKIVPKAISWICGGSGINWSHRKRRIGRHSERIGTGGLDHKGRQLTYDGSRY
jgi:hypothetical protein